MKTPSRLAVLGSLLVLGGCTVSHIDQTDSAGGGLFSTNSSSGTASDAQDSRTRNGNDKPAAVPPRPYRYYPAVFVYFDPERSLYFFPLNKKWTTAPEIPESFKLETRKFVTLQLATEKPYLQNKAHRKLYPPPKPPKKPVKKTPPAAVSATGTQDAAPAGTSATAAAEPVAPPAAATPAAAPRPGAPPPTAGGTEGGAAPVSATAP